MTTTRTLERLLDGNRRFAAGTANRFAAEEAEHRRRLADGQEPDTVVLTCSDSRVPPTLIFDQGLGDLFVIRVAGNVVTPEEIGSAEYAVDVLGSRLVLVIGHTGCGAVTAAVDQFARPDPELSKNIRAITDRIRPSVERAARELLGSADPGRVAGASAQERSEVIERAIRANVLDAVDGLRAGSGILATLADAGELEIIGAEYSLKTGVVELLG